MGLRSMLMTQGRVHNFKEIDMKQRLYDATSEGVTWRDVNESSIMNIIWKQMGPPVSKIIYVLL